jgi:Putative Holin-like Toxin (Hol-Tox)
MASAPSETGSPPPRLMRKLVFALLILIGFCMLILAILSYVVSFDSVKGKIVAHIEDTFNICHDA